MSTMCEREGCEAVGRAYYTHGRAVSTGPFTYSTSAQFAPEQPITLCGSHALDAFGVAFQPTPASDEGAGA